MSSLVQVEILETLVGLEVTEEVVELTEIAYQGIPGPQGATGPPGPSGSEEESMPIFPVVDPKSSTSLAAGASVNLDSVVIPTAKIGKVQQITLSSSAACKWEAQKLTAGVPTTLDVVFTSGNSGQQPSHEWEPPHKDYTALTGNSVNTFFRVVATNLDARNPANVYATFFFDEVDV
jgi:hypothetical protein